VALRITDDCTSCGACEPECPNDAISEGDDIFIINKDLCTECIGFFESTQCNDVCPVECCIEDEDNIESKETLIAKVQKLHPEKDFSGDVPSHK
jgi:ferredoxin